MSLPSEPALGVVRAHCAGSISVIGIRRSLANLHNPVAQVARALVCVEDGAGREGEFRRV
jgi:hypothetical protein